jgi:hypothetical protein
MEQGELRFVIDGEYLQTLQKTWHRAPREQH